MTDKRQNKPMKIGDIMKLPEVKSVQDKLVRFHQENEIRAVERDKFMAIWNNPGTTNEIKMGIVEHHLANVQNTMHSVELVGRVEIAEDPEAFFFQVDKYFQANDLPMEQAAVVAEKILNRWPTLSLQDIGLYFDHLTWGHIEVYGKVTVHTVTSNIQKFQEWVAYHYDVYVRNREHLIHKEGSRDFTQWINAGKPEGKVL